MNLMTVEEFGRRIGVKRATAYRIVAARKVDITDIGLKRPRIRISDRALEKYIARNGVAA